MSDLTFWQLCLHFGDMSIGQIMDRAYDLEAENAQLRAENETLKAARAEGVQMWDDIIKNANGSLNEEQIMKELSDYSFVLSQVPKVYCYITGDKWSKPNYYADDIIREAEDYIQERCDEAGL